MPQTESKIGVLCVDDNPHVADALRVLLGRSERFEWTGWLPTADEVRQAVRDQCPGIVLIDLDMPGKSPFESIAELAEHYPGCRVVVFSGHVSAALIDRALDAGAWGYASKNDGEEELLALCAVYARGKWCSPRKCGRVTIVCDRLRGQGIRRRARCWGRAPARSRGRCGDAA